MHLNNHNLLFFYLLNILNLYLILHNYHEEIYMDYKNLLYISILYQILIYLFHDHFLNVHLNLLSLFSKYDYDSTINVLLLILYHYKNKIHYHYLHVHDDIHHLNLLQIFFQLLNMHHLMNLMLILKIFLKLIFLIMILVNKILESLLFLSYKQNNLKI